ncbi:MarR family winged helix-turn-helix transcriptional regulator [Pseudonocardia kunmingensis]|uniref:DNA-binding MarR family transcriptional regulator n=1 Tax=Pseudonocardia kunmingensis TaxID=630975 RepID=A0A543E2P5_9PSEU|nr:MarR family transcriptional regulator [Pseudonocardia kunmingensis]TQM15833.1 DNA-binding MarR family transcriptional regulator [Pseudonocardia kunmingensis]
MPSDDDLALADEVSGQLIRLVRLMERKHAQYQADHPDAVERATYLLLVHLVKDGPRRAGTLAEAVHSDPSTISRQVAHLVRLGLVERTTDPEDGRATLLVATDEGRRVFEENRRVRIERIAEMLDDWPVEDRRKLAELLARFTTDFANNALKPRPAEAPPAPPVEATAGGSRSLPG